MKVSDIIQQRLINQQIAGTKFTTAQQLVHYMGAIQAQEYAMAKWAIGLRIPGLDNAAVEAEFNRGDILRTHLLRPTWHFVSPQDIKWMLELTAPQITALSAYMHRQTGLDRKIFNRCNKIFEKALRDKNYLTRTELNVFLKEKKIEADGHRLSYICMEAELAGVICSGPRKGNQFTYALLDERAPDAKKLNREEALTELCKRYFNSRSPATLKDLCNWSGLNLKDAKKGYENIKDEFTKETFDSDRYIVKKDMEIPSGKIFSTFLMPDYDEYGMSYKNRSAIFMQKKGNTKTGNPIFGHTIVINGVIAGSWNRTISGKKIKMETNYFKQLSIKDNSAMKKAVKRYKDFFAE